MESAVIAQSRPVESGFSARLAALPAKAKVGAAIGVAILAGILVAMSFTLGGSDYKLLFANVSQQDGGAIIERLQQMNVPYRFTDGGGSILVPASQVYDLRLKLSAAGLPKGTVSGYELLDKSPFGQTQGQERIAMQRALEGELTRTIQSIASVEAARVHLALPNQNGFFREQQKPSASVLLTLYPGRRLDRAQIDGIVHLVSASVPELMPKSVSVVDDSGDLLSDSGDDSAAGLDSQQLQYLHDVESDYQKRVMNLLEPIVGRSNLRASVTAELDFSQTELTAEEYKPNQGANTTAAVRAIRTDDSTSPGVGVPAGVPGATTNQPPQAAAAPVNGASQPLQGAPSGGVGANGRRENETRYELDKTVRVTRAPVGNVRRINAAVVVNDHTSTDAKGKVKSTPLTPDELKKITTLVQQAIGYDQTRGDSVSVINTPFRTEAPATPEPTPIWAQPWLLDMLRASAAPALLALVALVVVFKLVRPALTAALVPPPAPEDENKLNEVVDDAGAALLPMPNISPALEAPRSHEKLDAARKLAKDNPMAVANIVRGFMNGESAG
ncbi:MAG: flagellar M-ring protein FliF [Burkholderiales bacterium]|nr:flagellar M-ring protein FliF [Burkholderiales bacterium]